jgi:pyrimidine operon attenuation protein/uracil phosphoribosyltransferase
MNIKSAESIARCISVIAQDAAKLAAIDHEQRIVGIKSGTLAVARVALVEDIEKHEARLVRALQAATWKTE